MVLLNISDEQPGSTYSWDETSQSFFIQESFQACNCRGLSTRAFLAFLFMNKYFCSTMINVYLLNKVCSVNKILLFTGLPSLDFSDFFTFFLQLTGKQLLSF